MSEINKTTFNHKKNALGIFTFPANNFSVEISGSTGPSNASTFDLGSGPMPWRNIYGTASFATSASWSPGSSQFGLETGSTYPITASQSVSSSWALSASWAPGGSGTGLETGSTYPITASWAVSASWAPVTGLETGSTYPITASQSVSSSWALSASWAPGSSPFGLETGSTYPITASHSVTASYVTGSTSHLSSLTASYIGGPVNNTLTIGGGGSITPGEIKILGGDNTSGGDSLGGSIRLKAGSTTTGGGGGGNIYIDAGNADTPGQPSGSILLSTVNTNLNVGIGVAVPVNKLDVGGNISCSVVTASLFYGTASFAISASWAPITGLETGSTYPITASQSVSSSWALSASWAPGGTGTGLDTGSTYPFTSSWAESSSLAIKANTIYIDQDNGTDFQPLIIGQFDESFPGHNLLHKSTASYQPSTDTIRATNFLGSASAAISASWAPGGTGTGLETGSTYPFTSSWAVSASWAPGGSGVTDGGSYNISSSWASSSISASYLPSNLSRGGTFFDAEGMSLTNQFVSVWRAPYSCSVSQIYCTAMSTPGIDSEAFINVRHNFIGDMLTASVLAASGSWGVFSDFVSGSFAAGDTLEIGLISCSQYPVSVTVQVDFTR